MKLREGWIMENAKKKRRTKKKGSYAERCASLLDSSFEGAQRLGKLGELSDRLGGMLGEALEDDDQFKRYIVVEKGKNADGESYAENVERIYEKVDFRSMKEAAGAISAIADSVRSVYSVPDFKTLSAGASSSGEGVPGTLTVSFESGEEYAL